MFFPDDVPHPSWSPFFPVCPVQGVQFPPFNVPSLRRLSLTSWRSVMFPSIWIPFFDVSSFLKFVWPSVIRVLLPADEVFLPGLTSQIASHPSPLRVFSPHIYVVSGPPPKIAIMLLHPVRSLKDPPTMRFLRTLIPDSQMFGTVKEFFSVSRKGPDLIIQGPAELLRCKILFHSVSFSTLLYKCCSPSNSPPFCSVAMNGQSLGYVFF